jgi:chromosomal replication initiation ATPase DnaA
MITQQKTTAADYEWMAALLRQTEEKIQERFKAERVYLDVQMEKPDKTPCEQLLSIVAKTLGMRYVDYASTSKSPDMVSLKQIGFSLCKSLLKTEYRYICIATGLPKNTVYYNCNQCDQRLINNEPEFHGLYQMAEAAVVKWKISQEQASS